MAAGNFSRRQGDYERGKALAEETRALVAEHDVPGSLAVSIMLALCEEGLGNAERAIELYESALSQARADGDEIVSAVVLGNLGNIALNERDLVSAQAYIEESAELHRRLGQQGALANDLTDLGTIALAGNRRDAAATALRESLALGRAVGLRDILLFAVEGLAALALDHGDAVEAVSLLAATTRPRAELGFPSDYFPIGKEIRERTLQAAREKLGDAAFAAAWEEGEGLSLEEAGEAASRISIGASISETCSASESHMPDPPFSRMLELMQLAERNGFEYGWTYDSHILWQESYALLPLVADKTEKIKLGHCVTNPGIRTRRSLPADTRPCRTCPEAGW